MSRTQCYEWFKRFEKGRMSVGEDPRPGRPSTSTDDDHVDRVRAVIRGNRRLTVREFADEMGISIGSWHQILTEKLQMPRVSAKFVPRLLTDDQKEDRVETSQELLASTNGNENFLNTFAASYLNTQGLNNSSPASTLVDLTFQSRALRSFSLNQLRNLSL